MKILTVDDDPFALGILETVLRDAQYRDLTLVLSAEAALEEIAAAQTPFDCFLLDIRMPGMDGIELCARVREMPGYENVPIIMITAVTEKTRLNRALQAGATDYVNKPFETIELGTRLRAAGQLTELLARSPRPAPDVDGADDACVLRITDAITLEPARGVLELEELRHKLISLPSGVYSTVVLGFSVLCIETAFNVLPAPRLRAFLNEIARAVAGEFLTEPIQIAYAGNGVFALVLHKARQQKPRMVKQRIRRALDGFETPAGLPEGPDGLQITFGEAPQKGPLTGHGAAVALSAVIHAARKRALSESQNHQLLSLREGLRSNPGREALARPIRRAGTALSQVVPRRLAPNLFRASREEDA